MTCGVGMVLNGGGGSKMFLVYIPKGPTSLTDVLYCASWMVTLISVDNMGILVLRIGKYTICPRPEEVLLALTSRKLVCFTNVYSVCYIRLS